MRLKAILCLGLLAAGLTCVSCSAKNEAPKEQTTTENEVEEFLEKARDRNDTNVSKAPDTEEKSGEDKEEESIFKPQEELPEQEAEEESAVDTNPPVPISLSESVMSEAIVVDDIEGDLWEIAEGTETDYPDKTAEDELPVFYMSDNVNNRDYVTPVRNQGYTALCWVYSSLGAIESDLLKNHTGFNVESLNLSEKHCAYYNMHRAEGSLQGGIDEDYREFVFEDEDAWLKDYDTSYISVGGVTDYCLSLYTAWKGPVLDEGDNSFKVLKGQSAIYTDNSELPTDAYGSAVCHVQGVYEIPATDKNRNAIKHYIMEHGSVTASINADGGFWTGKKAALYDYKDYGEDNVADHEILIVGWDDEYSAEHFITKAPEDGAYICKNSWGTGYGAQGYFYMSYYDSVLCNNIVAAYDSAVEGDNDWYDNNYQYAGFITHVTDPISDKENKVYFYDDNNASYGITISPDSDEELCAVGYFSMTTATSDTVEIYRLPEGANEFYSFETLGEPVAILNCKALTGGYHTFSLEETIDILPDEHYLILVKPGKESKLIYEKEMDETGKANLDEWQHDIGAIHTVNTASGRSYLISEDGTAVVRQEDKDFFVKAYTKEKTAGGG